MIFGEFHVTSSVDNDSPYVQSQVIYTIRVYHAKKFSSTGVYLRRMSQG